MAYIATAAIMIYLGLTVAGIYAILPQYLKNEVQDFLQNI